MSVFDTWELVVGCEVHCQLATESKIFSAAPTAFGAAPNSQVNEVDLGLPGVLPVLNGQAVEYALRAAEALNCKVNQRSEFARKNYFYPDLPKGYQISQHNLPICEHGHLDIELDEGTKRVGITRIHMEEDAGKSSHVAGKPYSLVDLNRAGVPLVEIVSEPDMRHPDEVVAYLKELRSIVVYLGICDGNMEEGSFRCDANVSVRKRGETELGTRCELKNINSFKFIKDAIYYEMNRQIELIESGQKVVQQTRLYNPDRGVTFAMRDKEDSHDYRYFPEPDLPPLVIDDAWLARVRSELPELPAQKRERYMGTLGLSQVDAAVLSADRSVAEYFESALAVFPENAKLLANWVINEVLRETSADTIADFTVNPAKIAGLVKLIETSVINGKIAKDVFADMISSGDDAEAIVEKKGLKQVTDTGAIAAIVDGVMNANPDKVEEFRGGKETLIGWFVGQVMKASRGKANPQMVNDLLREKLGP
ncbi:MAG: Asp-tRNA(Asn)/Glu-tRNA(Gln) amidotransferase subunit GatB [bacterium]